MTIPTADEALERLKQGNERFRNGMSDGAGRAGSYLDGLADRQTPFAVILSCSDSRVPPEILFDTSLGDLFVVRVAGNVANTSSIASVEYAVAQIGTKLVVVMGHEDCGAVTAAVEGGDAGKNLNRLLEYIEPAIEKPNQDITTVARRNALNSADRLLSESEIIRTAIDKHGIRIVTGFFHFSDGAVEFE